MAASIVTDPKVVISATSPAVYSRWLATECPNNFTLVRQDYAVVAQASAGSPDYLQVEVGADYEGAVGNTVTVVDDGGVAYTGVVTDILDSPARTLVVDIVYSTIIGTLIYLNDNTLRDGYYFEGKLTVNGVEQALTIIASPNSLGVADLDVSGVLRIMVSMGKVGAYGSLIEAETNKSGSFTFAYRECWYNSDEAYTEEGNTWYYAEGVRSIEQGSNLSEFVATETQDAPFYNSFANPVFFVGLPFDLSFILPVLALGSPAEVTVMIMRYNAAGTLLSVTTQNVATAGLEGRVCSLNIDPASIEETAAYMTAEITTP